MNKLPEEILTIVFTTLSSQDLCQCQRVCRSWLKPARVLLLKEVILCHKFDVDQFCRSIDSNPNPVYLAAVKHIRIGSLTHERARISLETLKLKQLIVRFPFLKRLELYKKHLDLERLLDDDFCQVLCERCPRLEYLKLIPEFELKDDSYSRTIQRLPMLKGITLPIIPNPIEFLASFPSLRKVRLSWEHFPMLPEIIEHYPTIQKVKCAIPVNIIVETNRALEGLANIRELKIQTVSYLNKDTMKFLENYFSGLSHFEIDTQVDPDWTTGLTRLLKFAYSIQTCSLSFYGIRSSLLKYCVHEAMGNFFDINRNRLEERILELDPIISNRSSFSLASIRNKRRVMKIKYGPETHLDTTEGLFNPSSPIYDIDALVLNYWESLDLDFYRKMFEDSTLVEIASLKRITIKIARLIYLFQPPQLPQVRYLTLEVMDDMEVAIYTYTRMFPNLEALKLYYACGNWEGGECQIDLKHTKLERLCIDVTSIRSKTGKILKNETYFGDAFFVLDVNIDGEERLYKVTLDYLRITRIEDENIKGLRCGGDYIKLSILLGGLQYLNLYMYGRILEPFTRETYFDQRGKHVINAKVDLQ